MENRLAIVTGGSRGIGQAIALRLAREGSDVVLTYRRETDGAQAVVAQIQALGRQAWSHPLDLAHRDDIERFGREVLARHERVDLLVNNAGMSQDTLLATMTARQLEDVMQVNALGPIWCTRQFVTAMICQRHGRIVNVTSCAASKPGAGQSHYAAAKGAMESFTRALAVELAPRNILVNAVAPGVIETEMSEAIRSRGHEQIMQRLLVKRCARPQEVADWVVHLGSPDNQYLTGEIIHLDGGLKRA